MADQIVLNCPPSVKYAKKWTVDWNLEVYFLWTGGIVIDVYSFSGERICEIECRADLQDVTDKIWEYSKRELDARMSKS